jgi:hypothetical protein
VKTYFGEGKPVVSNVKTVNFGRAKSIFEGTVLFRAIPLDKTLVVIR